jgi:hypothetical protein
MFCRLGVAETEADKGAVTVTENDPVQGVPNAVSPVIEYVPGDA